MSVNRAAYFRTAARNALRGNWKKAVLTGFLAALLGGMMNAGPGFNFEFKVEGPAVSAISMTVLATIAAVVAVLGIVLWVIGSIVRVGYGKFNLDLVDGEDIRTGTLFAYFPYWKNALLTSFLQTLYQLLWTLLLIVRHYGQLQLRDDAVYSGGGSDAFCNRSDRTVQILYGGQPLAAVLHAVQLYRLEYVGRVFAGYRHAVGGSL